MDEEYLRRLVDYDEALANIHPSTDLSLHPASLATEHVEEEDAALLRLLSAYGRAIKLIRQGLMSSSICHEWRVRLAIGAACQTWNW